MAKGKIVKEVIDNEITNDDIVGALKLALTTQIAINDTVSDALMTINSKATNNYFGIKAINKKSLFRFAILALAGGAYALYNERRYNSEHSTINN